MAAQQEAPQGAQGEEHSDCPKSPLLLAGAPLSSDKGAENGAPQHALEICSDHGDSSLHDAAPNGGGGHEEGGLLAAGAHKGSTHGGALLCGGGAGVVPTIISAAVCSGALQPFSSSRAILCRTVGGASTIVCFELWAHLPCPRSPPPPQAALHGDHVLPHCLAALCGPEPHGAQPHSNCGR